MKIEKHQYWPKKTYRSSSRDNRIAVQHLPWDLVRPSSGLNN